MKTKFLFPNKFKTLGWLLFLPALITSVIISIFEIDIDQKWRIKVFAFSDTFILNSKQYFTWIENGILDEVLLFCLIIGGILIGFSKLKFEDEFSLKIRYESLVWATYLNYGLILFFTLFLYGLSYLNVLLYNTFTLLFFFILRFHYMIYKQNKSLQDD